MCDGNPNVCKIFAKGSFLVYSNVIQVDTQFANFVLPSLELELDETQLDCAEGSTCQRLSNRI